METQPLNGIEDYASGETPEDVAILYSWANLEGAKYRDFSANRREYRAQMRHRAAEQLRLMELRAQSEAEAAAAEAEAEAAAAHAEADAATVKLAANRTMQASGQMKAAVGRKEVEAEEHVEMMRRSSLREAGQQARRAAAERLEAARRAEAAALADSIARREEREIAEAQASALRQAAQYAESDGRNKQKKANNPEDAVPGRISDPYGPQVVAEGEYFERPGTPVSELEAIRFKHQREYIEQQTGVDLPPFQRTEADRDHAQRLSEDVAQRNAERTAPDIEPRRPPKPVYEERYLSIARDAHRQDEAGALQLRRGHEAAENPANENGGPQGRVAVPSIPYKEFRKVNGNGSMDVHAEVVSRIPEQKHEEPAWPQSERRIDEGRSQKPAAAAGDWHQQDRPPYRGGGDKGGGAERWVPPVDAEFPGLIAFEAGAVERETTEPRFSDRPLWHKEDAATLEAQSLQPKGRKADNGRISADGGPGAARDSWGPAWEQADDPPVADKQPRWSHQPEPARPEPPRNSTPKPSPKVAVEASSPAWLYPKASGPRFVDSLVDTTHRRAQLAIESLKVGSGQTQSQPDREIMPRAHSGAVDDTLTHSRDQVASRWFALKGVFAKTDRSQKNDLQPARESKRETPFVVVYSAAGGVGKTSLVATLGRTLSSIGEKVLLADTTSQGLLPFYFGASELHVGVVRTFSPPTGSNDAPIHLVSHDFASRERDLSSKEGNTTGDVFEELVANSQSAQRVLVDINAGGAWLIQRIASTKPIILVPLAPDMNSVIGLRAIERSLAGLQDADGKPLQPVYLLNQFDAAMPLHLDVREVLSQQLGERLLPFTIRRSSGVSEALAEGMTIVDYDPASEIAKDYMGVANWLRNSSAPATVGFRNQRWSER